MDELGLISASVSFVSAVAYVLVGARLLRRPVASEVRLAQAQFGLWWGGLAAISAISGGETLLASVSAASIGVVAATLYLTILIACAALWGLVGHLVFLFTGRAHLVPLTVYYGALYVLLLFYFVLSAPTQSVLSYGRIVIQYANSLPVSVAALAVAMLLIPELVGAVAYLTLSWKTDDPTLRFRTRWVGVGIVAWFLLSLVSESATAGASPLLLASPLLAVAAAALVLLAYYPPSALRARWGIRNVDEVPLQTGQSLRGGLAEGVWVPVEQANLRELDHSQPNRSHEGTP